MSAVKPVTDIRLTRTAQQHKCSAIRGILALYPIDLLELGSAECQRWARPQLVIKPISQRIEAICPSSHANVAGRFKFVESSLYLGASLT